jgi:hypothetical protein
MDYSPSVATADDRDGLELAVAPLVFSNPYEDDLEPPVLPGSDGEDVPGTHLR